MTTLSISLLLAACSAPGPEPAADPHDHAGHDMGEHAGHDMGEHAGHHDAGSDHMKEMAATREKLRAALGEAYDQPIPGLDAANAEAGEALYAQHCASCHGAEGKGDGPAAEGLNPPPGDLTDAFHARYYSDAARLKILHEGIEGTSMAGFGEVLTDAQLLDLYAHVRSLRAAP